MPSSIAAIRRRSRSCVKFSLAVVHSLEFAAINRDAGAIEQVQVAAERDEPAAHAPDRWAIVAAEVSDGFEIGPKLPDKPNQLDIALALALQPARRLNLVEIAVDIDLEHRRRMIAPAGRSPPG